jgi:RHS repeat-associated protein
MLTAETHRGNQEPIQEGSYGRSLYNFYRSYDPNTGRYLETDPIGQDFDRIHLYDYARNSPTNLTDPLGLIPPGWHENLGNPTHRLDPEFLRLLECLIARLGNEGIAAMFGLGLVGNFATGSVLTGAGGITLGGSVAPFAGIGSAGGAGTVGAAGTTAAGGATIAVAGAGAYVTALGVTALIDSVNELTGSNWASLSNTPSPLQQIFPNLASPTPEFLAALEECRCLQ